MGDLGLIPGLGRFPWRRERPPTTAFWPGEFHGLYNTWSRNTWASLIAQLVKNPLAMQETWVPSLSWEDPLEKQKGTHSSALAWRIPWTV